MRVGCWGLRLAYVVHLRVNQFTAINAPIYIRCMNMVPKFVSARLGMRVVEDFIIYIGHICHDCDTLCNDIIIFVTIITLIHI